MVVENSLTNMVRVATYARLSSQCATYWSMFWLLCICGCLLLLLHSGCLVLCCGFSLVVFSLPLALLSCRPVHAPPSPRIFRTQNFQVICSTFVFVFSLPQMFCLSSPPLSICFFHSCHFPACVLSIPLLLRCVTGRRKKSPPCTIVLQTDPTATC